MPITLLDFIRSGGDFALMGAKDIELADGSRLEAFLAAQLKSLGEADEATTEAMKALANRTTAAEDRLDTLETPAESVDLRDFESDGTIIERRPDGSTVEQHMEFDENNVPIKIRHIAKNSDGEVLEENETSLIGFSEVGGGGGSGGIPPAYEERLSGLETEVDGIQDSIEKMQSVAEGALGAISGIQQDVTELETEIDGIQGTIEGMQGVAEGALGAISGIQQNVSQLESTVEGVQQDVGSLQNTVGELQDAVGEMQGVAGDALTALAGVQQDVTELQTTVGGIQDSIEEMRGVAEGALGALASVQEDIGELQQAAAPAKNVDLSKFESEGKIEQTNKDNSTVTYSFGFDENGNLTQITDSKGNVTELIGFAGLGGETYESAEGKTF